MNQIKIVEAGGLSRVALEIIKTGEDNCLKSN